MLILNNEIMLEDYLGNVKLTFHALSTRNPGNLKLQISCLCPAGY